MTRNPNPWNPPLIAVVIAFLILALLTYQVLDAMADEIDELRGEISDIPHGCRL